MNRQRQQVDQALGNYTESLPTSQYLPCDDPHNRAARRTTLRPIASANWTPTAGVSASVIDVEYWDGTAGFDPICPTSPSAGDLGAQRLTVEVTYRDTQRQAQIVKRSR